MSFLCMNGIQTKGPKNILFRSRIEAQWAYVFDVLGFQWEYEPFDLQGYIPDFILNYKDESLLIEIKGDCDIWGSFLPHKEKIENSGWDGKFIILGSTYKYHDAYNTDDRLWVNIGKIFDKGIEDDCVIRQVNTHESVIWEIGGSWMYDILPGSWNISGKNHFDEIWAFAKNASQWKGNEKYSSSTYKNFIFNKARLNKTANIDLHTNPLQNRHEIKRNSVQNVNQHDVEDKLNSCLHITPSNPQCPSFNDPIVHVTENVQNRNSIKNEPIDKHAEIPVNTVSENLSENKSINPNDKHAEMPVNNISENLFEHKSINPNDKFEEDQITNLAIDTNAETNTNVETQKNNTRDKKLGSKKQDFAMMELDTSPDNSSKDNPITREASDNLDLHNMTNTAQNIYTKPNENNSVTQSKQISIVPITSSFLNGISTKTQNLLSLHKTQWEMQKKPVKNRTRIYTVARIVFLTTTIIIFMFVLNNKTHFLLNKLNLNHTSTFLILMFLFTVVLLKATRKFE